jgi:hypothetical protein
MIEPMVAHCFESDPCELLARVHGRHPVWIRLELANGAQDNFPVARDSAGTLQSVPLNPGLKIETGAPGNPVPSCFSVT